MIVCFLMTGTLDFAPQGFMDASPVSSQPGVMGVLFFMFVFGLAKAGVMPVHSWLPAAMVAPTPVSALLHAVAVVKVGAFSILRVTTGVFGVDLLNRLHLGTALGVVASVTIITASLIALNQDGLKRRLAFSTIGQLSYIVLGASLLTPHGLLGGMLHIAMHAFGKITLFFCAGAIQVSTGFKKVSQLAGLGRRMPWTLGAFLVGSLSVIGLPPGGGFLSKWFLLLGALESGQLIFLIVLLVSSFLNAAYFLPIVYRAFFEPPPRPYRTRNEGPRWCLGPILFTAGASVLLLLIPQPFIALARLAVRQVMGTG
jgi:multicomponent Na+:H+ antiporter subunit D